MNRFLIRLNRILCYLLLPLFIAVMITVYTNSGHFTFLNRGVANTFHSVWLNVAFLVLFTVHSLIGIRLALIRNKASNKILDMLLIAIGIIFIGGFTYFAFRAG